jgi:outer membrane biosynthesis protein TonB
MRRAGLVLGWIVATTLACGGIPVADLPFATDAAVVEAGGEGDGAEGDGAEGDGAVAGNEDGDVVPVPVDSGQDGAAAAEPAAEPEPAEPEPAEPEPAEPKPSEGKAAKSAEPKPEPKPDPKPEPKPDPEPSAEPKPAPVAGPKGTVKVEGPGRVVLFNQETGRHPVPGDVPVGTYVIRVKFGEKPVVATGKVKVTEAGLTIKCNESMGLCRGQ